MNAKKTLLKILDIDLDLFLNKKYKTWAGRNERLNANEYFPWSDDDVKRYLEINCGLSASAPVSGKFFIEHYEVFHYLKNLQELAGQSLVFEIDHLDAHADLGISDSAYVDIATNILSLPVEDRVSRFRIGGREGLNSGNFLAFLIAARWLSKLTYVNRSSQNKDIPQFLFKDFDLDTQYIQLKQFSADQMQLLLYQGDFLKTAKRLEPLSLEPEVAFNFINLPDFKSAGRYDLIFLTQSPQYTPKTSDSLIPLIKSYISFD